MTPISKTKQIYLIFLIGLLLGGCGRRKNVDVRNIQVDVKIERFDKEFEPMETQPTAKLATYLQKKYGVFYDDFIPMLLQDGDINMRDTVYFKALRYAFTLQDFKELKHDLDSAYPNVDKQQAELVDAFKHIKYYFPQKKLPRVYAYFFGL